MAENIRRLPSGSYRAQVKVGRERLGRTFPTMAMAVAWRNDQRAMAQGMRYGTVGEHKTLGDAIRRYMADVAVTHKGERWELVRCRAFLASVDLPLTLPLARITAEHLEHWRDARCRQVSGASVRREMNLLGSMFSAAVRWHWLHASPMHGIERPAAPPHRRVTLTRAQIKRMLRALDYHRRRPQSMAEVIANMMLLALRTGMRAGEIAGLTWANTHATYVTLPETKNGSARDVPLSRKARPIIARMRGWDTARVFPISAQTRDALWRTRRDAAGMAGAFTFHDLRHTAATWIGATVGQPGRLSFPEFCAMFGWHDVRNAMIYVNPKAADLADKL